MSLLKNTTINDTGFLKIPAGNTAQRPTSPSTGMVRFNTDTRSTEWYDGVYGAWLPFGIISPIASGGTSITDITQGGVGYRVHSFTTVGSSTFTVTRGGQMEFLIVAGGGSGGSYVGGGGGAGGVLQGTELVSVGTYNIIVGAGAASVGSTTAQTSVFGLNGSNSSALGFTAFGGGGGGVYAEGVGRLGGSGGGSGGFQGGIARGGVNTSGQGTAGGTTFGPRPRGFTGGGGGEATEYPQVGQSI